MLTVSLTVKYPLFLASHLQKNLNEKNQLNKRLKIYTAVPWLHLWMCWSCVCILISLKWNDFSLHFEYICLHPNPIWSHICIYLCKYAYKRIDEQKFQKSNIFLEGSGHQNFMNPFVYGKSFLGKSFSKKIGTLTPPNPKIFKGGHNVPPPNPWYTKIGRAK